MHFSKFMFNDLKIQLNLTSLDQVKGRGKSCKTIKDSDSNAVSGIYEVDVGREKMNLVCNMDISGGGWTVNLHLFYIHLLTTHLKVNLLSIICFCKTFCYLK